MSSVLIRPRVDDDLPACVEILRKVHDTAAYPLNWPNDPTAWITPDDALGIWVATADGQIAGHVALAAYGEGTRVERLYVDPAATGRGLGRELLGHCVINARELGRELTLEVADNGDSAIALYRRAGWRETGRGPVAWGGDRVREVVYFTAPD
ncbi:GNAT family N-acetyltransferase [Kribbella sp. NBC_01245]|uniref:GNAT family N-acetyltransferase n=1 Tax=Kribbella sp. NBC_01245 TaxID=2903578 RepID=UPI002E27DAC1|nr:GNAT family N-acetyltransferase [Kribbella sp. NBC_01245]